MVASFPRATLDSQSIRATMPALAALFRLGEPPDDWDAIDYTAKGVSAADAESLGQLAAQWCIDEGWESPASWAPVHAWRALAQLRAGEGVAPLLGMLNRLVLLTDIWHVEELPRVFAAIGAAAVEPVGAFLRNCDNLFPARIIAADALDGLGNCHRACRDACVKHLDDALAHAEDNDRSLNGFIIGALVDLQAAQCAATIERAYAGCHVDISIVGRWEDVRYDLRLALEPPSRDQSIRSRINEKWERLLSTEEPTDPCLRVFDLFGLDGNREERRAAERDMPQGAGRRRQRRRR